MENQGFDHVGRRVRVFTLALMSFNKSSVEMEAEKEKKKKRQANRTIATV